MFNRWFFFLSWCCFQGVICASAVSSDAARVVVLKKPGESVVSGQLRTAIGFYGLQEVDVTYTDAKSLRTIVKGIQNSGTVALALEPGAVPEDAIPLIFAAVQRRKGPKIPVLVMGIDEQTNATLLAELSGGAIVECKRFGDNADSASSQVGNISGLTFELSGGRLPLAARAFNYFILNGAQPETVVSASSEGRTLPYFVRVKSGPQETFFLASSVPSEIPAGPDPYRETPLFSKLAPEMIFLRHAAGERAWHSTGAYANLTIDDSWLKQSYGYVNYASLLREMDTHNFHTTVAFIPWNFDRNEANTVSLFLSRPDRYSICIHGNNHDHQEFGAYSDKPLAGQTKDIKQALARMAEFERRTHIPYDPVMVFPHSVSPESTFAVLKRYNFWATVNSLNVPMGDTAPTDTGFALRTATLDFADFPSLRRYSAEALGPSAQLLVDAFLGNPMLFYVHQAFFADSIGAFDQTADAVNRLLPNVKWTGLGEVVRHLYLERLREDGNYDVRTYSPIVQLSNPADKELTFFVAKQENFSDPLNVFVNGQPGSYSKSDGELKIVVRIPPHKSREIQVRYENDLNIASTDISKGSLRVQVLRRLSDFRDDVVSKSAVGRGFVRLYVQNEPAWNLGLGIVCGVGLFVLIGYLQRKARKRSSAHSTTIHLSSTQ